MEKDDRILDLAIHYALNNNYPETEELTKYQKRAVRKRAATLLVEKGEVYIEKKERKVKVISSVQEQQRILKAYGQPPATLVSPRHTNGSLRGSTGRE